MFHSDKVTIEAVSIKKIKKKASVQRSKLVVPVPVACLTATCSGSRIPSAFGSDLNYLHSTHNYTIATYNYNRLSTHHNHSGWQRCRVKMDRPPIVSFQGFHFDQMHSFKVVRFNMCVISR